MSCIHTHIHTHMCVVLCVYLVVQSFPTLCDPMNWAPDSFIHGILQARMLEWVAITFSRDLLNPGIEPWSPVLQVDSLLSEPPEKPIIHTKVAQ